MTTAQVVETSVNNSFSEDYSHPEDHSRQTTDTPGLKTFTNSLQCEDYVRRQIWPSRSHERKKQSRQQGIVAQIEVIKARFRSLFRQI